MSMVNIYDQLRMEAQLQTQGDLVLVRNGQ